MPRRANPLPLALPPRDRHTPAQRWLYDAVRTADDPDRVLMDFLQSTYDAAADLGKWDRAALECAIGVPCRPRAV